MIIGQYIVEDEPDRNLRRTFIGLHLTLVLVALVQAGRVLHHAVGEPAGHHHLLFFSAFQILSALLFLVPRTMRIGGIFLVVIFVHGVLFDASRGDFPATSLVFAAATLFVTVHGAAWGRGDVQARAI